MQGVHKPWVKEAIYGADRVKPHYVVILWSWVVLRTVKGLRFLALGPGAK